MESILNNNIEIFSNTYIEEIEQRIVQDIQDNPVFKDIVKEIVQEGVKRQKALINFELWSMLNVDERKMKAVTEGIEQDRKEFWFKSLEKAKGNREKAFEIYSDPSFV
ncbi:MAG: hypothetical protein KKG60_03165 [Nanoarchaeota archaeon]|nr:hypothetical protein [Nanoarchaeota archaeon]